MQEKHLLVHTFGTAIGSEHFWLGHVYSVLLQATILSNPFYKTLAIMFI